MYSATVVLRIKSFRPTDGTISPECSTSAHLSPPVAAPGTPPGVFNGAGHSGQRIIVSPPADYAGAVQLNFVLTGTAYTLVGLAFLEDKGRFGRQEFPSVSLNRSNLNSDLAVTDTCETNQPDLIFTYGIIVQELSSGRLGVIDPIIDNDPR